MAWTQSFELRGDRGNDAGGGHMCGIAGVRRFDSEPVSQVTTWVRIMPIAALAAETTVEGDNFN
jgi:hypothetical protein